MATSLMYPKMLFALSADRDHCWFTLCLVSRSNPRYLSAGLLSSHSSPSLHLNLINMDLWPANLYLFPDLTYFEKYLKINFEAKLSPRSGKCHRTLGTSFLFVCFGFCFQIGTMLLLKGMRHIRGTANNLAFSHRNT